jgi:8-oxo-dGTP diphosphatase
VGAHLTFTLVGRDDVTELLSEISPFDGVEASHRDAAIAWVGSGVGIYRVRKPDVPPKHLVSYILLLDVAAESVLLVDHRNAGRWLPAGGHVEPGEDPFVTAERELAEELCVSAELAVGLSSNPLFVTETMTVGHDSGHVDVSLWFVFVGSASDHFAFDERELNAVRWWTFAEVLNARAESLDPHLQRFMAKLRGELKK